MARVLIAVCVAAVLAGCGPEPKPEDKSLVNPATLARQHNECGLEYLSRRDLERAEKEFRTAISINGYNPAYNNLGKVYYLQAKNCTDRKDYPRASQSYHEACRQWEMAAKLMRHSAEPVNNLGIVMEEVTKDYVAAAKLYREALAREPNNEEVMANLARVNIGYLNKRDDETRGYLQQITLKDRRLEWRKWAQDQLAMWRSPTTTSVPAYEPAVVEAAPKDLPDASLETK